MIDLTYPRPLLIASLLLMPAMPLAAQTDRGDRDHLWADEMAAFAEQDAQHATPPGGVVFVGSSSIRLWDLADSFPNIDPPPLNRGFGGSHLEDSIRHVELLVLKHRPSLVVVYAGDNDIAAGKSTDRVVGDFAKLVERIHAKLPQTNIAYIAIKPSIARWSLADRMQQANERIAKLCDKNDRVTFVDIWQPMLADDGRPRAELFAEDGLHLNAAGYKLWASRVAPLLGRHAREQ